MRELAEEQRIRRFMRALGAAIREETRVYFTGGVSAVLLGWRSATIDIDLEFVPDRDENLRTVSALKNELHVNIEMVSPAHFIPPLPGWENRSVFIDREGSVSFYHYDFYSQALAKIERGHAQDHDDVASMLSHELIEPAKVRELFEAIVPNLYRYPAVDAASFRSRLVAAIGKR